MPVFSVVVAPQFSFRWNKECLTVPATSITTVLEAFIQGVGGTRARQQVAMTTNCESQATWSHDLMAFVHSIAALMYPCFPRVGEAARQFAEMLRSVGELTGWRLDIPELERKGLLRFQVTSCCLREGM